MPPIYIISLKSSINRRLKISGILNSHKLNFNFFDAIEGDSLDKNILNLYPNLSSREIGCALSHLELYQKMFSQNIQQMIILEDDVLLKEGFSSNFDLVKNSLPSNWNLILLGYNLKYNLCDVNSINKSHLRISQPLNLVYGAFGYLINKKGAQKLLYELTLGINKPIDHYTGNPSINNVYIIKRPKLVIVDPGSISTVHEQRLIHSLKLKSNIQRYRFLVTNNKFYIKLKYIIFKINCICRVILFKISK